MTFSPVQEALFHFALALTRKFLTYTLMREVSMHFQSTLVVPTNIVLFSRLLKLTRCIL